MAIINADGVRQFDGAVIALREKNGPWDSDFYAVVWDSEQRRVRSVEYASTRYTGGCRADVDATTWSLRQARAWLWKCRADCLRDADKRDRDEPHSLSRGDAVVLTSDHAFKDKRSGETIDGVAGDIGHVFWIGHFGTFYRNGYNHPSRFNGRVGIEFEDGRRIFCPMEKVARSRELLTRHEVLRRSRPPKDKYSVGASYA